MKRIEKAGGLFASFALFAALAAAPPPASAQVSDAEILMLPEYCQARFAGEKSAAYQSWQQRFGRTNFLHIHHYCYGLNAINKAKWEFEPQKKAFYYKRAIREFDYVLKRWPKGFSLTSTAMLYQQHAQTMLIMVP